MSLSNAPGTWVWKQHPITQSWYRVNEELNIWDGPHPVSSSDFYDC